MRIIIPILITVLLVTGCSNTGTKLDGKELEKGIEKVEGKIKKEWNDEKGEYRENEHGYFVDGDIVDITAVQIGEELRVTVHGLEWLSEEENPGEVSEGIIEMGHSDLKERPFVRVIDYSKDGEVIKDKKY